MTASTVELSPQFWIGDAPVLPLGAGLKALEGTIACIDTAAGVVKPAVAGNANLIPVGRFENTVDNTAGGSTVGVVVRLRSEIRLEYLANDTGAPITAFFSTAYLLDNQTVTLTSTGNSKAGVVWDIDAVKGIGILFPAL